MLTYPSLDIGDLRPVISGGTPNGGELGKAHTETHVVDVLVLDKVVGRGGKGRVFEELEESFAGEGPAS